MKHSRDEKHRSEDASRKRKDERSDKYMGSLSEGQKHKESSSGSEVGDIDIDEEDEEEKIIEMRRKKREELMKVIQKDLKPYSLRCLLENTVKNRNHPCFNFFSFRSFIETIHGHNKG